MLAEKRARLLSMACGICGGLLLSKFACAQNQVFIDNFNNGSVTDSDTQPGFWQTVVDGNSTVMEPTGGPETLTAAPANAADTYPFAELASTALQSSFNFFQQPIVLQASGLNYGSNSSAASLTEFNFGSQVASQAGPVETEYNEPSDFTLEILPLSSTSGQIIMGEKENRPNTSTPYDTYQLIGPIGPSTYGTKYGTQTLTGQIRSVELVLDSQYYYLSVTSDTSPTNLTPVTTTYFSGLNLTNTGQYPWTTGTYAPGDPSLNVETQIGGSNGSDQATLNLSQLKVSQLSLTYNPNGDGNYFTASNWSGLSGYVDPTTAAALKITIPDYTSASATFPHASFTPTVAITNGNGNTITVGTLNFASSYTLDANIIQFATSGSTSQVNVTGGNQILNTSITSFDPATNFNVASGTSVTINGNVTTTVATTLSSTAGAVTINGDIDAEAALTLNCGSGTMTINPGTADDFLFHGNLVLNVASGGTLTINSFIDDPSSPSYPVSKTGPGTAAVSSLQFIPSVSVTGGILRVLPSTKADSISQGASYINALSITGGKLDLTNNDMVIDYTGASPLQTVRQYLQAGSLYSSTVIPARGTALGYAEATEIGQTSSFFGIPTDSTSVCILYTYLGDLNLDGTVNGSDYTLLLNGNGSDWYNGDLNYDGVKNADDFALFQLGVASAAAGNITGLAVPEPGALAVLPALALAGIRGCRRRRTTATA